MREKGEGIGNLSYCTTDAPIPIPMRQNSVPKSAKRSIARLE